MWPGVEPTRGVYNETYLQVALNIVNRAVSYGIHSIVDFHQVRRVTVHCEYDGADHASW